MVDLVAIHKREIARTIKLQTSQRHHHHHHLYLLRWNNTWCTTTSFSIRDLDAYDRSSQVDRGMQWDTEMLPLVWREGMSNARSCNWLLCVCHICVLHWRTCWRTCWRFTTAVLWTQELMQARIVENSHCLAVT